MPSEITADGDGHSDRNLDSPGEREPLAKVVPPTITNHKPIPQRWANIIGRTPEGVLLLEFKRSPESSQSSVIGLTPSAAAMLMKELFRIIA